MMKTSVYLERWVDRDLRLIAAAEGKSKAQLIRETLAERARGESPQPRIQAIGVFEGPGDLSQNVDRYLEGFGED
jgi:hypothetical protein